MTLARAASEQPALWGGASHAGAVRRVNEDAFLGRPELGLWAVADGMGGHGRGDEASACVVEALAAAAEGDSAVARLRHARAALDDAHVRLLARAGPTRIIGATVVVLSLFGDAASLIWAGDCRAYRLRERALERLTEDHSLVEAYGRAGGAPGEAPPRHIVTRALGAGDAYDPESRTVLWRPGDAFLLCSDGLWSVVEEGVVAHLVNALPPHRAVRQLLAAALARGAPDNVTAVVVRPGA
ncbi:MAG TPA: PP2C family serine/threonine-protein phosphatase [Caulobacteraceae bacterium]|nr:PP2C family serine/threonine-protein phosphatase [Caulobacteraceae bacterium]